MLRRTYQEVCMPLIEVNGAQVYIEDTGAPAGRPDAPAVVFGHGLLFSGRMYAAQVDRLKDRYRCVTIDWRGQGKSPGGGDADMDALTEDAAAIIESLNAGPVHYVGLSMGGFVGIRLGARRPELLRSLALLDTSSGPEDPDNVSKYRRLARVYRVVGMRPVSSQVTPIMFGKTYLASEAGKAGVKDFLQALSKVKRPGMVKAILGVTDRPRSSTSWPGSIRRPSSSWVPKMSRRRSRSPRPSRPGSPEHGSRSCPGPDTPARSSSPSG
jgi:3-oxoadipate enol-lactonase